LSDPCRILVVDDSRIFRCALEEALAGVEGVRVAGSVWSGEKALEFLAATPADLVTLDVDMPGLDGLATLRQIQALNAGRPRCQDIGVLMVSALTLEGAQVTVEALQAGAFDFVTKPAGPSVEENREALRQQLACKIRLWTARCRPGLAPVRPLPEPLPLRAGPLPPVRAVLVAASTGGPEALCRLLPPLCGGTDLPILIVQHMPDVPGASFTAALAASLDRKCGHAVREARDGEPLAPRRVLLAPGGRHLLLRRERDGRAHVGLNDQPPENGFRPSADVLFRSAAAALGGEAVAVVLTGMDCDGSKGLRPLKRAGAHVIAQDEASNVVWGMPGAAVRAGVVDQILPLDRIAAAVLTRAAAGQSDTPGSPRRG
jgi:two-component system, chemotaxis family, protein-glutamate methylesterase/glutaminase